MDIWYQRDSLLTLWLKNVNFFNDTLKSTVECLTLVTNVSQDTVIIKFIDRDIVKVPLLQFTISNLYDLEEQLYAHWIKARKVLKAYNVCDSSAELNHIVSYYHSTAYVEMMHACLL